MKKISRDIKLVNIFFILSFIAVYILFSFYISYQFRTEQKKEILKLKKFILNEKAAFEKDGSEKEIESFIEDVHSNQKGNSDFSINFNYDKKIAVQNPNLVKPFGINEDKIVRDGNFYVLNFKIYVEKLNKNIEAQIVNDFSDGLMIIERMQEIFMAFLSLLFLISILITKGFYNKIKNQIEFLKKTTDSVDLNNFEDEIEEKNFYKELASLIRAYKLMVKKIKMQTEREVEFVNSASHELKTPIFIIGGYADLLEKKGLENQEIFYESVNAIKTETKEMGVLIEKLLFLARKNYTDIFEEKIELNEMFEIIKEEMKIVYPECRIKIIGELTEVVSDKKLLKQLFRNIIENGIKYGNDSEIEIIMSENKITQEKKVIISDFGTGLNEDELKNIFNKFYRGDKSRDKSLAGHGLGLSIVSAIAEILNIKIDVKSKKNEGSSFSIIFNKK